LALELTAAIVIFQLMENKRQLVSYSGYDVRIQVRPFIPSLAFLKEEIVISEKRCIFLNYVQSETTRTASQFKELSPSGIKMKAAVTTEKAISTDVYTVEKRAILRSKLYKPKPKK
jgi:hypothetical protein